MSSADIQFSPSASSSDRLERAKGGCRTTLGELLEEARCYLHGLAHAAIDSDIQGKLSASDLVQETLIDAHHDFANFQGTDTRQLLAWLRRILVNNLLNHYRRLRKTRKRDVSRERNGLNIDQFATSDRETPSAAAITQEEQIVLDEELACLPVHYRQVIELRHREQLSFVAIAEQLGKSPDAVRMIWYRAFDQLSRALERRLD